MNPNGQRKQADREWFAMKKALGLKPQSPSGDLLLSVPQTRLMGEARHAERVLELGCAGGEITLALKLDLKSAYGIDASPAAVAHCKKHIDGAFRDCYEHVDEADWAKEHFGGNFDVVIVGPSIMFLANPAVAINAARINVRDGGTILLCAPKQRFSREMVEALSNEVGEGYRAHIDGDVESWYLSIEMSLVPFSYVLVTAEAAQVAEANEVARGIRYKSGAWNWCKALKGEAVFIEDRDKIEAADVVHVQVSGAMLDYPRRLRAMLKDHQQLVVNVDYSVDMMSSMMQYPELFLEQVNYADRIFSVEPHGADFFSHMLRRPCPEMPHPLDLDTLKKLRVEKKDRSDVLVLGHRLDQCGHLGLWHWHGMGQTLHYVGPNQKAPGMTTAFDANFHYVHEPMSGLDMVKLTARMFAVSDCYSHAVTGRFATEAAALGIPCIGFRQGEAQRRCFPLTTYDKADIVPCRDVADALLHDGVFYEEVCDIARTKVEHYNYENAVSRFQEMLDDAGWSHDPRLGVPEGTQEARFEAGCGVGHPEAEVEDRQGDGEPGEPLQLQGRRDDGGEPGRELSAA